MSCALQIIQKADILSILVIRFCLVQLYAFISKAHCLAIYTGATFSSLFSCLREKIEEKYKKERKNDVISFLLLFYLGCLVYFLSSFYFSSYICPIDSLENKH